MLAPEAHVDEQETLNLEAVGPRPTRRTTGTATVPVDRKRYDGPDVGCGSSVVSKSHSGM